jgi:hypothetical protein
MATETPVLDYVLAGSGQLSSWALAVAGASVAAVVGTSYRRPETMAWRLPFLLFIPGWLFLADSLYCGHSISGRFLAAKMVHADKVREIASKINDLYESQRTSLLVSLGFFGVWLAVYICIWVFTDELAGKEEK